MAKGITKAQRELQFAIYADGNNTIRRYVDSGECLSMVNRKLFSQKMVYGIEKIEFDYFPTYTVVDGIPVPDFDYLRLHFW